jgi:hypothetical protein
VTREAVQLGAAAAAEESEGTARASGTNRAIEAQKVPVFMVASMIASVGEKMSVGEETNAYKTANAKMGKVLISKQEKAKSRVQTDLPIYL